MLINTLVLNSRGTEWGFDLRLFSFFEWNSIFRLQLNILRKYFSRNSHTGKTDDIKSILYILPRLKVYIVFTTFFVSHYRVLAKALDVFHKGR